MFNSHLQLVPIVIALIACISSPAAPIVEHPRQRENTIRHAIEREAAANPAHPWLGEYYAGDGLGTNISLNLAPKAGFAFTWHGCLGLYGHNYGGVVEKDGKIILRCKLPNTPGKFGNIYTEYFPVRWGTRRYLVPCDKIIDFCNDVNGGEEPRKGHHGSTLLAVDDANIAVTGFPGIPEQYAKYLLTSVIHAQIVKRLPDIEFVDEYGDPRVRSCVTIDAGEESGIFSGMRLYIAEPDGPSGTIFVKQVRERESDCIVEYLTSDDHMPKIGWKVSSRLAK